MCTPSAPKPVAPAVIPKAPAPAPKPQPVAKTPVVGADAVIKRTGSTTTKKRGTSSLQIPISQTVTRSGLGTPV